MVVPAPRLKTTKTPKLLLRIGLHVLLWVVYEVGAALLFSGAYIAFNWQTIVLLFSYFLSHATAVYTNNYYLLPRYLKAQRYLLYLLLLLLLLLVSPVFIIFGYYVSSGFPTDFAEGFFSSSFWFAATYASTTSTLLGAMGLKLSKNWLAEQRKNKQLQQAQLQSELTFLRQQLNPHFLFNIINSIYFLIRKDAEKAEEALVRFSDLLRYQLYECNDAEIALAKEWAFIAHYTELERLRQPKELKVRLQVPEQLPQELKVAPFILTPFVENAFKHAEKTGFISISLVLEEGKIVFEVRNSASIKAKAGAGGIGLQNVQRRLTLIYPQRHQLTISPTANEFYVQLTLIL